MIKRVIKRNGQKQTFSQDKIDKALRAAFISNGQKLPESIKLQVMHEIEELYSAKEEVTVEKIQDIVENVLLSSPYNDVAKSYILYREKHKELRLIEERVKYINDYMNSGNNAATSSETDANANVSIKNVANIDGEVYKTLNRQIQRYRMRKKLEQLYPEVAAQYEKDLDSHIIYTHDEASAPTVKNYCEAVSLYPILMGNSKIMDGIGTTAPHGLGSFCGQLVNLTFLLAAQCKGAVAFGEFFNFLDYFCVKDFGEDYYTRSEDISSVKPKRSVLSAIHQAYQQIVYGWNQPAGNRSYQSPFTNISYYDKNYWHALFDGFAFPDGTKPSWERVDFLQRDFMQWFNKERTKSILTFPVETMALLSDGKDIIDQDYKNFTAEMYAKGHSFFTYISDNPNALASCCFSGNEMIRVKKDNEDSFLISIRDFVAAYATAPDPMGVKVNTNYQIESYNIQENYQTPTEITGVLKKSYTGIMYTIKLDTGNTIEVTADHILCVKDLVTGQILEITAEQYSKSPDKYLIGLE